MFKITGIERKILFFFMLLIITSFTSATLFAQWQYQYPVPTGGNLIATYFTDAYTGWAGGYNVLMKTTDGGYNWDVKNFNGRVEKILFVNADTGFIAAANPGAILKTTNGGISWDRKPFPKDLKTVIFLSDSIGWAVGAVGGVFRTNDGGESWKNLTERFNGWNHNDIFFYDNNLGWIAGGNGVVYKTTDGGENWSFRRFQNFEGNFNSIYFLTPDTGVVVGANLTLKTTNGGQSWYYTNSFPHSYNYKSLQFISNKDGFAVTEPYSIGYGTPRIIRTTDAGESWQERDQNANYSICGLHFPTSSIGYAVGVYGSMYKTTNKGITWNRLYHHVGSQLRDIYFRSKADGWAAGDNGYILRTTDGGHSWNTQNINNYYYLKSIFFVSDSTGWITGTERILKTTNGGTTWTNKDLSYNFNKLYFFDEQYGWAVSQDGKILRTTNGGQNWNVNFSYTSPFFTIYFLNQLIGFAGTSGGKVFKTTNGGNSWTEYQIFGYGDTRDITFLSEKHGWFVGGSSQYPFVLKTTDQGITWEDYTGPVSWTVTSVKFFDENTGYIYGNGAVWKTTNAGNEWYRVIFNIYPIADIHFVEPDVAWALGIWQTIIKSENVNTISSFDEITENSQSVNYFLSQNYPNPFNPVTNIKFSIPWGGYVSLKVYDILGSEIAILIDEDISEGTHEVNFNAAGLPSGIYFYRLQARDIIETKKMLFLK
jgi:photosystem II stability/assembly factor-like uncharacterized protein